MQITNLDLKKYKRFFAFGCSFTNYIWPTWADIIGREIPYFENWGMGGAGNQFIFNSVIECNRRHKLTEEDLVIIMWTSCSREDRYVDRNWLFATSTYQEKIYGKRWVKQFGNQSEGLMLRDFATIDATHTILNHLNVDWINLNSLPLIRFNIDKAETNIKKGLITFDELEIQWNDVQYKLSIGDYQFDNEYLEGNDIIDFYKDIFIKIKEPMFTTILKNKQRPNFGDDHPTPCEYLDYINTHIPNNLSADNYVNYWNNIVNNIKIKDIMPVEFIKTPITRF